MTNRSELRERWIVLTSVLALVLARSAVFVFREQTHFDSDQAVIGLMGKHLSELRAFPVFMYGQSYILGVEAWMAAPIFWLLGVSVTSLKLPLLAINLAVAILLLRTFEREVGLRPAYAGVASVFFVLCPPGTAARLLEASGGNLEPFLYVTLIWLTRRRPAWCGFIFGLGFLHREFTLYGLLALLMMEAADRSLFTREGIRRRLAMLRTAAEVWLVVQLLHQYSSAAGPGTTVAILRAPPNNLLELAARTCLDAGTLLTGIGRLATTHWPRLFGTAPQPLMELAVESQVRQGARGASLILAAAMLLALVRIAMRLARERQWKRHYDFCAYLTIVGILSALGYVAGRCGHVGFLLRYDLLSILAAVGVSALYLRTERSRAVASVWLAAIAVWTLVAAIPHGRLLSEYLGHPPERGKYMIVRALEARGIRYATASYWNAYYITFLTNERIIVDASRFRRIPRYRAIVAAHADEAVRISGDPCEGGEQILTHVYFCPP